MSSEAALTASQASAGFILMLPAYVGPRRPSLTPELRNTLRADVYRYRGRTGLGPSLSAYLREPGFRFTCHLRGVADFHRRKRWYALPAYVLHRALLHRYRFRFGFDISPMAPIGPGLLLGHFGGVVISPHAVLGRNVNIGHGATIGAESRGPRAGAPALGDCVWVGAHAIIVGKITIGDEALIAPGAFVNFDVPAMAVVLGNPGKVVSMNGSRGYINKTMDAGDRATIDG